MVECICIPSLNLRPERVSALAAIYPDGQRGEHWFGLNLRRDDSRAAAILDQLAAWKLVPWIDPTRPRLPNEYNVRYERHYEPADLAGAELLELRPPSEACNYEAINRGPGTDGELTVPAEQMPGGPSGLADPPHPDGFDFMFGLATWIFVPQRVKAVLERGGLHGVRFRPTLFIPLDLRADDTLESLRARCGIPYWEIDSGHRLPPLSPSMVITDGSGQRIDHREPYTNGFHRRDGLYVHAELHYRRRDLTELDEFDLARTFEVFGNGAGHHGGNQESKPFHQPLVASHRFYQFCVERGLSTGWAPVRIDE